MLTYIPDGMNEFLDCRSLKKITSQTKFDQPIGSQRISCKKF